MVGITFRVAILTNLLYLLNLASCANGGAQQRSYTRLGLEALLEKQV